VRGTSGSISFLQRMCTGAWDVAVCVDRGCKKKRGSYYIVDTSFLFFFSLQSANKTHR